MITEISMRSNLDLHREIFDGINVAVMDPRYQKIVKILERKKRGSLLEIGRFI